MEHVYTPTQYNSSYPNLLRTIYNVNNLLKKDGIMAPSCASFSNTSKMYDIIGRPLESCNIAVIHVGGTNGKGSTSFKIAECLRKSGLKTGLFVSPHLSSFRERVQINGQLVSEEEFVPIMSRVLELCATHEIPLTLFEITYIYGCLQFESSGCQVVVLEVGVGGELDATNVIQKTSLSIICSVSLDHTRILGATVEEIACKKGGIFKTGVDALVGPGCPISILRQIATERGAHLHELTEDQLFFSSVSSLGSGGDTELIDTDALNSDISYAALQILKAQGGVFSAIDLESLKLVVRQIRPPCRWEIHRATVALPQNVPPPGKPGEHMVEVVLDVGHNPAAVGALMKRIKCDFAGRNVHLIYAMSRDKDVRTCLRSVFAAMPYNHIHFAQSTNFRAISKEDLNSIFREETDEEILDLESATSWLPSSPESSVADKPCSAIKETLRRLLALAASESSESAVVVCGTGYIMPDAREMLGIIEPRDDRDLLR